MDAACTGIVGWRVDRDEVVEVFYINWGGAIQVLGL